tara:strand:+ start:229 stop:351 length:123 start_codon:yes stop_codon:yes gene_type:complete
MILLKESTPLDFFGNMPKTRKGNSNVALFYLFNFSTLSIE